MKNEPIRILNIVPNMKAAGVESFIMNIYRNIDRSKVQFDFIVHNKNKEFYDDEIEKLGGKIYRFTYKDDKNIIKYIRDLNHFFIEHPEYKIVHGHMQSMMPLYLRIAKKHNVSVRIAHSHNNSYEKSLKGFILHIFSRLSKYYSNVNFACSNDAGKYLFKKKEFSVIYNGIDFNKFVFSLNSRLKIRNELNINDNIVLIGNIGRTEKQKNQFFLLDFFSKIVKKNKNYRLIIIGTGSLENKLIEYSKKLQISNNVIFKKNINNINEYMCAMDAFCLPSLYEGLGIVLIEAQVSGLKCFATKDTVAKETNISNNIKYLPLNSDEWANNLLNCSNNYERIECSNNQFDIKNVATDLENRYISFINKM